MTRVDPQVKALLVERLRWLRAAEELTSTVVRAASAINCPHHEATPPMSTAREIMTPDPECVSTQDTVQHAAERMAALKTGALPICGPDRGIKGVITDRDIVVHGLATGKDPARTICGDPNQGEAVTVGADDDTVLVTMTRHQVRRLPVIDGDQLVGMISVADVARALSPSSPARSPHHRSDSSPTRWRGNYK